MRILKPLAIAFLLPATFALTHAKDKPTSMDQHAREILAQDTVAWDSKLPFDQDVKVGKLKNGFQYFIRKNVEPKDRVTMYLGTKVGAVLETEQQLGLAHFLEHMNFNGLKHFPKNELVNYLQKAGVRFGSDLNAYTGFDQTVYQLPIPSDDPELLKNGLQVMRDWAQDALLTDEEIDKERGIVLEEMRGGRGASQRLRDKFLPVMLNNSHYANRLPIGTEDVITNFPYEELRKFHQDWYRPDLQAIIIVGDIDVAEMEKEVQRLFSDMKTPENAPKRTEYKVGLLNKNQFLAITDPELPYTTVQVTYKFPEEKVVTVGDYRKSLIKTVFNQMISARLTELAQQADAPFLQASVSISGFLGGLSSLNASYVAKPNAVETGFKAVVREMERAQQFGFNRSEFDRAIAAIAKFNENSYIERDKKKSDSYVQGYLNFFLEDSPVLGNEDQYKLLQQLLPTLTLKEVESILKTYYVDNNRDVIIMAPDKDKDLLPQESVVYSWFDDVNKEQLTAYEDKVSELPLLAKQPTAGTVVSSTDIAAIETRELTLSNGVKVLLKPTAFKNNEILISAFSPGGTSLYGDADYYSASNAAALVVGSGAGQHNTSELKKYLSGKNVSVRPYINERFEGLTGSSDKEGLETAFELMHAFFTAPRIESDIFQNTIARLLAGNQNREDDPNYVFMEGVLSTLYKDNIRRMPISDAGINKISKDRSLEIFKERFADASDFTITLVGSFTEAEIKPLLEKYIASLPTLKRQESAKDLGIYEPAKGVEKVVYKGKEAKANVRLSFYTDYAYSDAENLNVDALKSTLTIKLIERLREDESGVYGTGASASTTKYPKNRFGFHIGFGTSLEKYESLIASALDEVEKIKKNGPEQGDLDKFVIEQQRQMELQLKENRFWLSVIAGAYQNQEDPTTITKHLEALKQVTPESVKAVANKYLNNDQMFKFILLPEQTK